MSHNKELKLQQLTNSPTTWTVWWTGKLT